MREIISRVWWQVVARAQTKAPHKHVGNYLEIFVEFPSTPKFIIQPNILGNLAITPICDYTPSFATMLEAHTCIGCASVLLHYNFQFQDHNARVLYSMDRAFTKSWIRKTPAEKSPDLKPPNNHLWDDLKHQL